MKVGLVLLLLNLHDAFSDDFKLMAKGISYKKSPKKNLELLISKRVLKPNILKTKKPLPPNNGYTVFPAMGIIGRKVYDVPDSPIFPASGQEQKTRVKKVLPDYAPGVIRKKRETDVKNQENKTDAGSDKITVATTKTTTEQIKESVAAKKPISRRSQVKTSRKGKNKSKSKSKKHKKRTRKQVMRTNRTYTGKPLRYTKRSSHKETKTKPSKTGKSHKESASKSGKSRKEDEVTKAVPKKAESRRLIAAKDAIIEDYPYVVSIQKNDEHWCAGALLNPRLVITTANCMWKASRVSRMRVRAGSRYTDRGGQMAKLQEVRKHPEWNIRKNPDNDVALLLLDRNIKFSHSVHGVDLPNRIMLPAFEDAWVTSWGAERRDGVYDKKSMILQSMHTQLMDLAKCNNVTQRFGVTVTENFICLSQTGQRAPCTRDTGAPAVSDGVLWGLASWGIRKLCGTQRFPAMFSYLASQSNMDFILNATHTLMADERHYPFPDRYPQVRARTMLPWQPGQPGMPG